MKRQLFPASLLSFLLLLNACSSYRVCTPCVVQNHGHPTERPCTLAQKGSAAQHWWYHVVPRHRCQIRWYDLGHWMTWALLGNDDDGVFGEEPTASYQVDTEASAGKAIRWACRNPLHNFCFYVIGTAHSETSEFTLLQLAPGNCQFLHYKPRANTVFAGDGSSLYLGFHSWLPFISLSLDYGRKFEFYAGWRERGNFGLKFRPMQPGSRPQDPNCCPKPCGMAERIRGMRIATEAFPHRFAPAIA